MFHKNYVYVKDGVLYAWVLAWFCKNWGIKLTVTDQVDPWQTLQSPSRVCDSYLCADDHISKQRTYRWKPVTSWCQTFKCSDCSKDEVTWFCVKDQHGCKSVTFHIESFRITPKDVSNLYGTKYPQGFIYLEMQEQVFW